MILIMLLFYFAHAHAHNLCELLLSANTIPRKIQPLYPIEIQAHGMLIQPGQRLPIFETGFYVYLILNTGEILLSERYHLWNSDQNLVTHKSLLEIYRGAAGRSAEKLIVAAGEFQMAYDEVLEINNKSGNFPGDSQTLRIAIEVFRSQGLPITRRTRIRAITARSVEERGHTPSDRDLDWFRIQTLKAVHESERGRELIGLYRRMYFLTRETFPRHFGMYAIEALMNAQAVGAGHSGKYAGYQSFYYPLQCAFGPDGLEYGIFSVESHNDRGGDEGFAKGVPRQILNFRYGAQLELNLVLTEKWKQLARDFRALAKIKN